MGERERARRARTPGGRAAEGSAAGLARGTALVGRTALVLRTAVLIGVPLLLRILCFLELRREPLFRLPVLDARIYHEMALRIASGTFQRHEPFWQPPLYPYFLALLYKLAPSPDIARLAQAILGSLSCLLVFRLGERILNRRAAWIAWGIVAAYGPLILFDLQLLNVSLAIFLLLLALDWITAAASATAGPARAARDAPATDPAPRAARIEGRPLSMSWRWPAAGLALGIASITVATFLVFIPAILAWMLWTVRPRVARLPAALFLAAAALPVLFVTASNWVVSREPVLISYNGGLNFWLGNNPDHDRTVEIRPGRQWIALNDEPRRAGVQGDAVSSHWWFGRSVRWIREQPGAWIRLLAHKTLLFVRGNEIARNQESYAFREHSFILRSLLWIRGIAFPFGLLLPVAVAGIALIARGSLAPRGHAMAAAVPLLIGTAGLEGLTVIAFFVTERYRLPVVPILALLAGGGVSLGIETWREHRRTRLLLPAILGLGVGFVANTGLPAMPRWFNSDAYSDLGLFYQEQGNVEEAVRQYEAALRRDPENLEAANNLGGILLQRGDLDGAASLFRKILETYPDDSGANTNLGSVYFHKGDPYTAGEFYRKVYTNDPTAPQAGENLRGLEQVLGKRESERLRTGAAAFLDSLERQHAANPRNEFLTDRLVRLLESRGEIERARRIASGR